MITFELLESKWRWCLNCCINSISISCINSNLYWTHTHWTHWRYKLNLLLTWVCNPIARICGRWLRKFHFILLHFSTECYWLFSSVILRLRTAYDPYWTFSLYSSAYVVYGGVCVCVCLCMTYVLIYVWAWLPIITACVSMYERVCLCKRVCVCVSMEERGCL